MLMNKTKWLSGLAFVAVIGSAATPMIASAHNAEGEQAAQSVASAGKIKASGRLAEALGVEPAVLEAAVKAALAATPKPEGDQKNDPAAREAYRTALQQKLASELGVTVERLQAAIQSLKDGQAENGKRGGEHEKILGRKLADALHVTPEALAAAVKAARDEVPPLTGEQKEDPAARKAHAAAIEAAIAKHLGITVEAFNAAQETLKATGEEKKDERRAAAEEKAQQHLTQALDRLIKAGVVTQAQADEIRAQFNLGGDARKQALEQLRTLLQEQKAKKHDDKREEKREENREHKDGQQGPKHSTQQGHQDRD